MFYVVTDTRDLQAWYPNFLSGLKQALEALGIPHQFVTEVPAALDDPVFLTRYTLYDSLREMARPPRRVIIHEHDVWNPFTNVFNPECLWVYNHPSVRVIAVTNPSMLPWVTRCIEPGAHARAVAAGFPYDHGPIERIRAEVQSSAERERLVVFPGRLNDFYQPYVAFRMAYELKERGYRTVIASSIPPLTHYPVQLWQELGVEVGRLAQADYYRLLAGAQAAISCTIGGSLTLALYEAWLLGAQPVAPAGRSGLPPFTEMYSPRYDLLNPMEAIAMVEERTPVEIDLQWFDKQAYVLRILEALR